MGQDPREMFRKLQQGLNTAQQRGAGGLPGGPKGFFAGTAGLLLLGTGVVVVNNALFNGTVVFSNAGFDDLKLTSSSGWWSPSNQIHQDRWCTERDIQ